MASFPCMFLLFPLLIITPFIQPAFSDLETQELIEKICRQCEDYGFCNRIFNENLKTPTTDVEGLAQITVEQSLYYATNTYIFVKKLIANTSDAAVRDHLRVCDNSYNAVLNLFQEAFRSFDLKDYRSMMAYEWDTQRAAATCDAIFSADSLSIDQLIRRNQKMRILIAMALQTSSILIT